MLYIPSLHSNTLSFCFPPFSISLIPASDHSRSEMDLSAPGSEQCGDALNLRSRSVPGLNETVSFLLPALIFDLSSKFSTYPDHKNTFEIYTPPIMYVQNELRICGLMNASDKGLNVKSIRAHFKEHDGRLNGCRLKTGGGRVGQYGAALCLCLPSVHLYSKCFAETQAHHHASRSSDAHAILNCSFIGAHKFTL